MINGDATKFAFLFTVRKEAKTIVDDSEAALVVHTL